MKFERELKYIKCKSAVSVYLPWDCDLPFRAFSSIPSTSDIVWKNYNLYNIALCKFGRDRSLLS